MPTHIHGWNEYVFINATDSRLYLGKYYKEYFVWY